jgi:hypothetical protein
LQNCELWLPPDVIFPNSSVDEIPGLGAQDDSNNFDWTSLIEDPYEKENMNNTCSEQQPFSQEPKPVEEVTKMDQVPLHAENVTKTEQAPLCIEPICPVNGSEPCLDIPISQPIEEIPMTSTEESLKQEAKQALPIDSSPESLDVDDVESVPGLSPTSSPQGTFEVLSHSFSQYFLQNKMQYHRILRRHCPKEWRVF